MEDWCTVETVEPLPENDFWRFVDLIQDANLKHGVADLAALSEQLVNSPTETIAGFDEMLARKVHALDTRKHYKAFSWLPGLSDTFYYARLGVVAMGKEKYNAVVASPKSFPKRGSCDLEELLYVARQAHQINTGYLMGYEPSVSPESFSNEQGWEK